MADSYYKSSDQVLTVDHGIKLRGHEWETARTSTYAFDFEFKVMIVFTWPDTSKEKRELYPFSTLDTGVLEKMRNKLIELGGKPDPLVSASETKPAFPAPRAQKGLNP